MPILEKLGEIKDKVVGAISGKSPEEVSFEIKVKKWLEEAKAYHAELAKRQEVMQAYYEGDQTQRNRVPAYMCNAVDNVIYRDVETLVPMVTAQLPEFVAIPNQETEADLADVENVQQVLSETFTAENVQKKMEKSAREMFVGIFGALKVSWARSALRPSVRSISNKNLYLPRHGQTVDELPFLFELHKFTADEWKTEFGGLSGDSTIAENAALPVVYEQEAPGEKSAKYHVFELWTNEWHVWLHTTGKIFKKEANPLMVDPSLLGGRFKKPYIIIASFEYPERIIGETSLIEQAIPLQDIVNICTRQIANNAVKMSNGTWLVDSSVMSEEEAKAKINNAPGLIIWGNGAANGAMVRRDTPPAMPEYVYLLLQHAKNSIDTIFGTNSTTRGERSGTETKGGRILLREADTSRADTFVRPIHRAVEDLGNLVLKYYMLFGNIPQNEMVLGTDGTVTGVPNFGSDMARKVKEVRVIASNTLPKDPINENNRVLDLFAAGILDQMTALEKLHEGNPREIVERSLALKAGQIPPSEGMGSFVPPPPPVLPPAPLPQPNQ